MLTNESMYTYKSFHDIDIELGIKTIEDCGPRV